MKITRLGDAICLRPWETIVAMARPRIIFHVFVSEQPVLAISPFRTLFSLFFEKFTFQLFFFNAPIKYLTANAAHCNWQLLMRVLIEIWLLQKRWHWTVTFWRFLHVLAWIGLGLFPTPTAYTNPLFQKKMFDIQMVTKPYRKTVHKSKKCE